MTPSPVSLRRTRLLALAAGGLAFVIGTLGVIGWLLGDHRLTSGLTNEVTMKANTAVGLCLLAGANFVLQLSWRSPVVPRVARAVSALAALLGVATLSQHLFGWDLGIDQLLFREVAGAPATTSPGRMGPPACLSFILLGAGALLLDHRSARGHSPAQWLALLALPLPVLALLGYLTGATQLYGIAHYTGIAMLTAAAFCCLSLALLLTRAALEPAALLVADDPGGEVVRTMLPAAVLVPVLLTKLRIWGEGRGLYDAAFGRALTLLALIATFTLIIWRTAQRLSAVADERQRLELQRAELLDSERAARQEAERSAALKDQFLATLSHELRTPLNAILGWVTILRRAATRPPELERPLEVIERSARVQAQLIEDLLDVSRIVSGKLRLALDPVDISNVINMALQTVLPIAEGKRISVEVALEPQLPLMAGDGSRLQQVVWNLLSNAVKFTPEGGKVKVTARQLGERLELSVSDTGVGITPEFLPHVFDRFRQADSSSTRPHGGLGLGLSIVRQLVELHGGTISVASGGKGQGSTFAVMLPVAPEGGHAHPVSGASLSDSALAGLVILVVDDEPDSRELMGRVLSESQASVRLAASAAQALAELERAPAHVLVSDIGMPGTDGYELIRAIRKHTSAATMPAIAVTAFARADDRERALEAGFQLHISKPINPSGLLVAIATLTGRGAAPRNVA